MAQCCMVLMNGIRVTKPQKCQYNTSITSKAQLLVWNLNVLRMIMANVILGTHLVLDIKSSYR